MPHTRMLLPQPAHHVSKAISSAAPAGCWQGNGTASMVCLEQGTLPLHQPQQHELSSQVRLTLLDLTEVHEEISACSQLLATLKFWPLPGVSELCSEVLMYTLASGQLNFYILIKKKKSSLLLMAENTSFSRHLWLYAPCLDVSSLFIPLFSFLGRPPQLLLQDVCMETALRKGPHSLNRSHEILCLILRTMEKNPISWHWLFKGWLQNESTSQ